MLNLVVLVSGGGTNLQAVLDAIDSGKIRNARVTAVISNNPGAYALERARKHGIDAVCISPGQFSSRGDFEKALLDRVKSYSPDLVVLAGCLVVIPPEMVEAFPNRIINIHPALIPSFCGTGFYGLMPHEAVLKRGCRVTGATVHFVDAGTDSGPIILQKAVYVQEGDTPEILQRRVMEEAEWKIMPEAINLIAEGRVSVENGKVIIKDYTYGTV
ncbi:MAG: phosphoribosylglycinamide formyltransferase [Eubacterium sp.]|jgi:phosphoribosylglycinamide formyltransferase-1|nr:phosphoribosylglycinamide formyltransferase [Eubacterium sp.]